MIFLWLYCCVFCTFHIYSFTFPTPFHFIVHVHVDVEGVWWYVVKCWIVGVLRCYVAWTMLTKCGKRVQGKVRPFFQAKGRVRQVYKWGRTPFSHKVEVEVYFSLIWTCSFWFVSFLKVMTGFYTSGVTWWGTISIKPMQSMYLTSILIYLIPLTSHILLFSQPIMTLFSCFVPS